MITFFPSSPSPLTLSLLRRRPSQPLTGEGGIPPPHPRWESTARRPTLSLHPSPFGAGRRSLLLGTVVSHHLISGGSRRCVDLPPPPPLLAPSSSPLPAFFFFFFFFWQALGSGT